MQQLAEAAMEREAYAEEVCLFPDWPGLVSDAFSRHLANLDAKRHCYSGQASRSGVTFDKGVGKHR